MQDPTRHLRRLVYFEFGGLSWRQEVLLREELEHGVVQKSDETIENEASIVEAINSAVTAPTGATAQLLRMMSPRNLIPCWQHRSRNSRTTMKMTTS